MATGNSRIARNTGVLYVRMLLIMAVNLYMSRVVLDVLGVEDYGIYNVVGGIVMMFSFMNGAMVAASQRFITYELGTGTLLRRRKVFSISVCIHALIAGLIFLLAETIGIWFLNEQLNIPEVRMTAANWIYQCSILSFMVSVLIVPYTASVIAHERMNVYAYVGIMDVALKLSVTFLILWIRWDKLILYAVLLLTVVMINGFVYTVYCKRHFRSCRFDLKLCRDRKLFRDMFSFAGWSFVGNFGFSAKDYGVNILINLFFGPAVNAARALAYQVSGAINAFVSNFHMAMNPQITKRYAVGERDAMVDLVERGSRYSFFLLAIIVVPVLIRTPYILGLWLKEVPEFSIQFLRLVLLMALVNSMTVPLVTAIQATGHIKKFQIVIASIMLVDLPLSYLILKLGAPPYAVMYIAIGTAVVGLLARLSLLAALIQINVRRFVLSVYMRCTGVFTAIYLPMMFASQHMPRNFVGLILLCMLSLLWSALILFFGGCKKDEREFVMKRIHRFCI